MAGFRPNPATTEGATTEWLKASQIADHGCCVTGATRRQRRRTTADRSYLIRFFIENLSLFCKQLPLDHGASLINA